MAVEKQGAAKPVKEEPQLGLDCFMIGPMCLGEPLIELFQADRSSPQISVLGGSCRNNTESAAGPRADPLSEPGSFASCDDYSRA